jgi:hypothetical protein
MHHHGLAWHLADVAVHAVVWQSVSRILRSMTMGEMFLAAGIVIACYLLLRRPY